MSTAPTAAATVRFDAIGVPWSIDTPTPLDLDLLGRVMARIEAFDATYSRFRDDSLVTQVASSPTGGEFLFPDDSRVLFELYDQLHVLSDGAVDPLVGRQLELLGYDAAYSLRPVASQDRVLAHDTQPRWSEDIHRDGTRITTREPVVIDVGAAGKGYLVDLVLDLLREGGVDDVVVDASGDLRHHGPGVTRVGLEHPTRPDHVVGAAPLQNQALCASAVTRRAWGDGLHHVLDPRTGIPTRDILATWVVADTAAVADGLATALFLIDPPALASGFDFAFVRMRSDGHLEASAHFPGDLFAPDSHLHLVHHQGERS